MELSNEMLEFNTVDNFLLNLTNYNNNNNNNNNTAVSTPTPSTPSTHNNEFISGFEIGNEINGKTCQQQLEQEQEQEQLDYFQQFLNNNTTNTHSFEDDSDNESVLSGFQSFVQQGHPTPFIVPSPVPSATTTTTTTHKRDSENVVNFGGISKHASPSPSSSSSSSSAAAAAAAAAAATFIGSTRRPRTSVDTIVSHVISTCVSEPVVAAVLASELSSDKLANVNTREFNRLLKTGAISKDAAQAIKDQRRRLKNREAANVCRMKRQTRLEELEQQLVLLQKRNFELEQENGALRKLLPPSAFSALSASTSTVSTVSSTSTSTNATVASTTTNTTSTSGHTATVA